MIDFFENSTVYIKNGTEHKAEWTESDGAYTWCDGEIAVKRRVFAVRDGVFRITDVYENVSDSAGEYVFVLEINTGYEPYFTLVPSVSYDGNRFGKNGEPKGLTRDGKPWIFGYSRTGLPSATVTEGVRDGKNICVGLFASAENAESLESGCSIVIGGDGDARQRIYRPEIEAPVTYAYRDAYADPILGTVKLDAGERFECVSFAVVCEPEAERFGVIKVYDAAAMVLDMTSEPAHTEDELWKLAMMHTRNLLVEGKQGALFVTGLHRREPDTEKFVTCGGWHELGWCGQNSTLMLAYVTDYVENGNRESLEIALCAIDTWLRLGTRDNGWLASHIEVLRKPDAVAREVADTVNTGYGAMQMLHTYAALKKAGVEKPELFSRLMGLMDLYVSLYSDELGMPSAINMNGNAVSYTGSGGMFAGFALTTAYKYTNEEKYLETAKKLLRYYYTRDLSQFACAAGALDTSCVDKESCCPFLYTALDLYELTGEREWLDIARHAAVYLATWMFTFDAIYPETSDFAKMGFHTKGGTVVSAQHAHIDPWGGVISADMARYAALSGDETYAKFAKLMWDNVTYCIADGETADPRGRVRPRGSQGEAYAHTNWYFSAREENNGKGFINDWLVAWPSAHRMATMMRRKNGEI